LNSSGLATLVRYYKLARSNCGDISLAALQPSVRQAFQLSRLDRVFDLHPDVARAVQRFIGPQQAPSATTKAPRQLRQAESPFPNFSYGPINLDVCGIQSQDPYVVEVEPFDAEPKVEVAVGLQVSYAIEPP
jgi:hypothetical protein